MPRFQFRKREQQRIPLDPPRFSDAGQSRWADAITRILTSFDDQTPISCRIYNGTDQTINASAVVFDTSRFNNGGIWSSTLPKRFVAVQSGVYQVSFHCTLSGGVNVYLRVNGTTQITPAAIGTTVLLETKWSFAQNDYVEVFNSGGAATCNSLPSYSPEMSMHWLSPIQE